MADMGRGITAATPRPITAAGYGGGYAPAYYGGGYYGGPYVPVVRYRRVIRPAYAYYGGPRFYGPRYYGGYYRRW